MLRTCARILFVGESDAAHRIRAALPSADGLSLCFEHADSAANARQHLQHTPVDLVLLDPAGCGDCGLEGLAGLYESAAEASVVVLAESEEESSTIAAVVSDDRVADERDIVLKTELTPGAMRRMLRYAVERRTMRQRLQRVRESLQRKTRQLSDLHQTALRFADHVSHEFRTPLTVVKEFATLVRDGLAGEVNSQQREFLAIVNDRCDDLAILVDDMLDVSKLDAGMLSVWRRKTDLGEVFAQHRPALMRKAAIKRVPLKITLAGDLPRVYCDPEKIGRVIVNLTVNAIRSSADTPAELTAEYCRDSAEVVISVRDHGPGIAPRDLASVFDRVGQVDAVWEGGNHAPFGLGLHVAQELVRRNLGRIDVESRLDEGSRFSFGVPAWDPELLAPRWLRSLRRNAEAPQSATLVVADVERSTAAAVCCVVDEFLQHVFRGDDLVVPAGDHRWLVLTACGQTEVSEKLDTVRTAWDGANRSRPGAVFPEICLQAGNTCQLAAQAAQLLRQFGHELRVVSAIPPAAAVSATAGSSTLHPPQCSLPSGAPP